MRCVLQGNSEKIHESNGKIDKILRELLSLQNVGVTVADVH